VICLTGAPSLKGRPTFCAGGDVVAMVKAEGDVEGQHRFFQTEYSLNHLIGTCRKPVVSLLDGITSTCG
jgi:enoyl-CoA hydratase/carnithine racemase